MLLLLPLRHVLLVLALPRPVQLDAHQVVPTERELVVELRLQVPHHTRTSRRLALVHLVCQLHSLLQQLLLLLFAFCVRNLTVS